MSIQLTAALQIAKKSVAGNVIWVRLNIGKALITSQKDGEILTFRVTGKIRD